MKKVATFAGTEFTMMLGGAGVIFSSPFVAVGGLTNFLGYGNIRHNREMRLL